ncbi:tetratricopeptide repeat protein [Chitinilyticum piscinae]|uniref:Tetratricopeptide repeat protein n=1 Tax=Chitinilyticum piscinae TaxID=2866724 RepID=A0A8J7K1S5_9NEIS|nr:tetratricopeptide repeat protein [Chitinilyticum piscinae]MBE9609052.1 tetratricopeptide repeat protein [Chitinilyticum piscinae]
MSFRSHAQLAQDAVSRGDWHAAERLLVLALQAEPGHPGLLLNLGNVLNQQGEAQRAAECWQQAAVRVPDWPDPLFNLGNLALRQQQPEAAISAYRAALQREPAHADTLHNLGECHFRLEQYDDAKLAWRHALRLRPAHAATRVNLARVLRMHGDYAEARALLEGVPSHAGEYGLACYALGTLDLLEARWESGWARYEARLPLFGAPMPQQLPCWKGEPLPEDAHLLLMGEQGFGDMLQFARFISGLRARVPRLTVIVPAALVGLLRINLPRDIAVASEWNESAGYTHYLPYMSMAAVLGVDSGSLDARAYLQAPESEAQFWHARRRQLGDANPVIGLAWQGNPAQEDNARRSIPPAQLAPLLALPVQWVSLQKGVSAPAGVLNWVDECADFADTAALLTALDGVVTVCTSVVHLAGALGVPTLLLSRKDADWRWGLTDVQSHWYDSVRILRQQELGQWSAPLAQAAEFLRRQ